MINDDEVCRTLLRSALPPVDAHAPSRDLWPSILERSRARPRWSIADWSAAAIVVIGLLMFPEWFWFLAYHM